MPHAILCQKASFNGVRLSPDGTCLRYKLSAFETPSASALLTVFANRDSSLEWVLTSAPKEGVVAVWFGQSLPPWELLTPRVKRVASLADRLIAFPAPIHPRRVDAPEQSGSGFGWLDSREPSRPTSISRPASD